MRSPTSPSLPSFFHGHGQLLLQVSSPRHQLGPISLPSLSSEPRPTQLGVAAAAAALTREEESVGGGETNDVPVLMRPRGGAPRQAPPKPSAREGGGGVVNAISPAHGENN
ncbi:hypothetical protein ABZP36_025177 [Zizania latifolia]